MLQGEVAFCLQTRQRTWPQWQCCSLKLRTTSAAKCQKGPCSQKACASSPRACACKLATVLQTLFPRRFRPALVATCKTSHVRRRPGLAPCAVAVRQGQVRRGLANRRSLAVLSGRTGARRRLGSLPRLARARVPDWGADTDDAAMIGPPQGTFPHVIAELGDA